MCILHWIELLLYYLFNTDGFHPHDISRIKNSDDWIRNFLIENDGDLNNALEMLWDTCVWRKKNDVNGKDLFLIYIFHMLTV